MTTQQPEALRLANVCSNLTRYSMDAHLIAAELRRQHARITDLESQLAQRFDAADVATAAAQGFRDGIASLAASAGSEPVAWMYNRLNSELNPWLMKAGQVADDLRVGRCDPHFGVMLKPCDNHVDWTPLYTHPSPPEGMVGGWMPLPPPPSSAQSEVSNG